METIVCDNNIEANLLDIVCSMCGISKSKMLSRERKQSVAYPRWLYWYACRYATKKQFAILTHASQQGGHKFSTNAICSGCNSFSYVIKQEPIWARRWNTIKEKIDKEISISKMEIKDKIIVRIPSDFKELVKIEYY